MNVPLRVPFLKQRRVLDLLGPVFLPQFYTGMLYPFRVASSGLGCRKIDEGSFLPVGITPQTCHQPSASTRHNYVHYISRCSSLQMCLDSFFHLNKSLDVPRWSLGTKASSCTSACIPLQAVLSSLFEKRCAHLGCCPGQTWLWHQQRQ